MFVPSFFVRSVRKKFDEVKNRELTLAIEKARLNFTNYEYAAISLFYSILATVPGAILGYLVSTKLVPYYLVSPYFPNYLWTSVFSILFASISFLITRYLILSYPFYVANLRAKKIDSALPHAVNTMLGMTKGGINLIMIFRFIAEQKHIFDELSREFEKIILLVDLFGYDLLLATRFVSNTTPSEKLKTFLENLINVYEGGGKVTEYLKSKSEQYFSERETTYSLLFETLQIFSEIYLALFIVAPLFFLIVLVVFQMLGGGVLETYRILLYLLVPLGSFIILFLVRTSMPFESSYKELSKIEREVEKIDAPIEEFQPEFRILKFKRMLNKIKYFLLQPFQLDLYMLPIRALIFYLLIPPTLFIILGHTKFELDVLLFVSIVIFITPLIFFIEYKNYLIKKMETQLPDFLKQLASLNEAGLNVVEALKHISEAELGLLSREISYAKREIEWGELITSAFKKMERRVRSSIFARAISMLIKAIEATPNIREALLIASTYSEFEVAAKSRVRNQMFMYTVIIYMAMAVFLYTAYVMLNSLLTVVSGVQVSVSGISIGIDFKSVKMAFFETSIVVSVFSGLVAGYVGEGRLEAGLKHILILTVIVYAFFRFLIH
ncbi:MAG: type II secretion system F family protein [Archaeoglobales archaeon]|nr:type II secretion system F family protein [Archaeoglobales archaeon]